MTLLFARSPDRGRCARPHRCTRARLTPTPIRIADLGMDCAEDHRGRGIRGSSSGSSCLFEPSTAIARHAEMGDRNSAAAVVDPKAAPAS